MDTQQDAAERLAQYVCENDSTIKGRLGIGNDGIVWRTERTAIKVFWPERARAYETEVKCYERLADNGVKELLGFTIPRLIYTDDELMIVEMEFVTPPSLFDFGKACLDIPPRETFEDVEAHQLTLIEQWGDRLPTVKCLLKALENHGIYYLDPRPGNIQFRDDDAE